MDLFTSHESGREENFLIDLFVLLVFDAKSYLHVSITQYEMICFGI